MISFEDQVYWIRPYVRGHWFGCSLRPGTPLNSPCQEVGFIYPFVVIHPTCLGATTVVAPGLMLDNFLPIPDAESLPFYPSVLKQVVCAANFLRRRVAGIHALQWPCRGRFQETVAQWHCQH